MIAVETLSPDAARDFASLTFPVMRQHVTSPEPGKEMVYVGARAGEDPVGFAFGMGGPRGEFEVLSVHVGTFHRDRGLGRRLLATVEQEFAARGYRLGVHFFTVDVEDQAYARFLLKAGWSKPIVRQVVCKTDLAHAYQTPWLIRARLPAGYEIRPWLALGDAARESIRRRKESDPGFYPDKLDPFEHEAECHAETSLALLRGDTVVGWMLTHVLDDNTLRWTISYVSEELQGAGRILPMWWEAVQRQKRHTELERFIWTVPIELPRMARFAERRMRPWLLSLGYACTATKEMA